jgi:hypothetical protein
MIPILSAGGRFPVKPGGPIGKCYKKVIIGARLRHLCASYPGIPGINLNLTKKIS